jgi:hypothetical protein
MTESPGLTPITAADPPPTGPETVCPAAPGAGAPPAPTADPLVSAAADRPPMAGPHTLQTGLLGPLIVPDGAARAAEIEELSRRAAVYATRAKGDGTRRAYRSAWRHYAAWCAGLGREPLAADPDTIAMYVVSLADAGRAGHGGLAVSSIRVHLAAIKGRPDIRVTTRKVGCGNGLRGGRWPCPNQAAVCLLRPPPKQEQ